MKEYLQNRRLQWFGNLQRMEENVWPSATRKFMVGDNLFKE